MKALKWTSPIRRNQSRKLPPLPNEIYLEILEWLQPSDSAFPANNQRDRRSHQEREADYRRTLSRLALVCHYFCYIALSRLLDSITFHGKESSTPTHTATSGLTRRTASGSGVVTQYGFGSGYASFCRFVNKGQEPSKSLANLVRECTFDSWGVIPYKPAFEGWSRGGAMVRQKAEKDAEPNTDWAVQGFLSLYSQAITRMPNLESIIIQDTYVNKQLITAISRCTAIKSLAFRGCAFNSDVSVADIMQMANSLSNVESFELKLGTILTHHQADDMSRDPTRNPFQSFPWPTPLTNLTLPSLFPAQIEPAIQHKAGPVFHKTLTYLSLNYIIEDQLKALFQFLDATPQLSSFKILAIHKNSEPSIENYPIRKSGLTHLHTLHCPPLLARSLLPGRQIHTLELDGLHVVSWTSRVLPIFEPRDRTDWILTWMMQSGLTGNLHTLSMSAYDFVHIMSQRESSGPGFIDTMFCEVTNLNLTLAHLNFGMVLPCDVMGALHQIPFPKLRALILDFPAPSVPLSIDSSPISTIPRPPPLKQFKECDLSTHHAVLEYLQGTTMQSLENVQLVCDIKWRWRAESKAWQAYVPPEAERMLGLHISNGIAFGNVWVDHGRCLKDVMGDMEGILDG
ncbi:hypothetical protein BDN72DRAFT_957703 [Pluteus cervinus]|uniref:Uncharacterized protein n=1 Tax=Pluteus cervinus TaxID=181527 RepID=A0ACD3B2Z7_9AGAR|nr:hypothetical protein BDN72DRAFT_957703 [Pluteus cervinus]